MRNGQLSLFVWGLLLAGGCVRGRRLTIAGKTFSLPNTQRRGRGLASAPVASAVKKEIEVVRNPPKEKLEVRVAFACGWGTQRACRRRRRRPDPTHTTHARRARPNKQQALGVAAWPIWSCEASTFPWTYAQNETCLLLEGDVTVTPDGGAAAPASFGAGDLVTFPAGMSCT